MRVCLSLPPDLMYQLAMGGSGPTSEGGVTNRLVKQASSDKIAARPLLTSRVPKLSMDESRKIPVLLRSPKLSMDESGRVSRGVLEDPSMLSDELRTIMLEEEIKDLKNALNNEKKKNARLMNVIEQRRLRNNHMFNHVFTMPNVLYVHTYIQSHNHFFVNVVRTCIRTHTYVRMCNTYVFLCTVCS